MSEPTVPAANQPLPEDRPTPTVADASQPTVVPLSRPGVPGVAPVDGRPFGRYRLVTELGHGGMGRVWKAWDPQLARFVALKQVLGGTGDEPEARARVERFRREAQLAARLRHPGIVAVHDVGEEDGMPFFTADYVEAEPLDAVIARSHTQGVPQRQAVLWVKAVAEALGYAHAQGVVHRDVKPGNILIDAKGEPHVTDFGLAKEVDLSGEAAATGSTLTMSGALVGTPQYMSPEQATGRTREIGPAGDQFSLGVVLYELATGQLPFRGESLRELLNAVAESEPSPPSRRVDRDLETICLKALEKDPSRRYASMADLAADLGRWLDRQPIHARPISGVARLAKWAARRRAVLVPLGVAAVAFAVGLPWWVSSRRERDKEVEEASTRTAFERAARVQDVLWRWAALEEALRGLEEVRFDDSIPEEERSRRAEALWPPVQEFIDATPRDPSSRATMLALAGWARRRAGRGSEGLAWMAEASRVDPDLPYGAWMEALVVLEEYLALQPMPDAMTGVRRLEYRGTPTETAEMAARRAEMEPRLARAAEARVWGAGVAQDFRLALDAIRAMQGRRYEEAERGLTAAIGRPPLRVFRTDLLMARAKVRAVSGRFREAIEDLVEVVRARPRWIDGRLHLGYARYAIGEAQEAIEAYDAVIAIDPRHVSALLNRGVARWSKGENDAALEDYAEVLKLQPGKREALINRSVLLLRKGEPQAALADAREAATRHPEEAIVWVTLAQALAGTGDRKGAIEADTRAIGIDPRFLEAWADRASRRTAEGDFAGALSDYDEAIRIDPSLSILWRNRAGANRAKGDGKAVLADLERAVAADPKDGAAWRELGTVRFEQGDLEGAVKAYSEAITVDPKDAEALCGRGVARHGLGQAEAAIADFTEAIRLAPGLGEAYTDRAVVHFERRDFDAAIADCDAAIRLDPKDATAHFQRGVARFSMGKRDEALADMGEALRLDGSRPDWWAMRAQARRALGDLEGAIEDYRTALERTPEGWKIRGTIESALRDTEAERAAKRPR